MGRRRTSVMREAERGIRYGILAVFVVGLRRRDPGAVVNAIVALLATYVPGAVEFTTDVEFEPWQRVYVKSAALTHAVGMLGPYDDTWWWDHMTHAHSASVLGGFVYTVARRRGRDPRPRVLSVVFVVGLLWELMEHAIHRVAKVFGFEPLLIPYGERDTLFDIGFDLFGAVLVLVFGNRVLENLTSGADDDADT